MRVTAKDVKQLLERLLRCLRRLLTNEGRRALEDAIGQLGVAAESAPCPWRYEVFHERPLKFLNCLPETGCELDVDIFCRVGGPGLPGQDQLSEQSVVVRIWAAGPQLFSGAQQACGMCDNPWKQSPDKKHVIARFHLDRAERSAQAEPLYHMQVGGCQADEKDVCWLPVKLEVPRFPCFPADLVLACELILASFKPEEYAKLRSTPEWRHVVRQAEMFFVKSHLDVLQAQAGGARGGATLLELVCDMSQGS